MIRRTDFDAAKKALQTAGLDLFLDHAEANPRNSVHIIFSGELVKPGEPSPNPDVTESTDLGTFKVLDLAAHVRIKLTAFRDKDRTHIRDMIGVGLIDKSWITRLEPIFATRLQQLLDTPDG